MTTCPRLETTISTDNHSMVRPSDFAPAIEIWTPLDVQARACGASPPRAKARVQSASPRRRAALSAGARAQPPPMPAAHARQQSAPDATINYQFASRRRPPSSIAHREPGAASQIARPAPLSLLMRSTQEPAAKWAPATETPKHNVCSADLQCLYSPAVRSLSTVWGTSNSAAVPPGCGWHSWASPRTSPREQRQSTMLSRGLAWVSLTPLDGAPVDAPGLTPPSNALSPSPRPLPSPRPPSSPMTASPSLTIDPILASSVRLCHRPHKDEQKPPASGRSPRSRHGQPARETSS